MACCSPPFDYIMPHHAFSMRLDAHSLFLQFSRTVYRPSRAFLATARQLVRIVSFIRARSESSRHFFTTPGLLEYERARGDDDALPRWHSPASTPLLAAATPPPVPTLPADDAILSCRRAADECSCHAGRFSSMADFTYAKLTQKCCIDDDKIDARIKRAAMYLGYSIFSPFSTRPLYYTRHLLRRCTLLNSQAAVYSSLASGRILV